MTSGMNNDAPNWIMISIVPVLPQLEIEIPFLSSQTSFDFDQIPWICVHSPICFA